MIALPDTAAEPPTERGRPRWEIQRIVTHVAVIHVMDEVGTDTVIAAALVCDGAVWVSCWCNVHRMLYMIPPVSAIM